MADAERIARLEASLEEANREVDLLLYAVSHDLRAPLRTIDGFSQALVEDYGETLDETAMDYVSRVRRAVKKMEACIDGVLVVSRETRGDLRVEDLNISLMASEVSRELNGCECAQKSGHRPEVSVAEGLGARGDRLLVRSLLRRLLENAYKFSLGRPDARVELGRADLPEGPAFFVRDNGCGFDMNYARHRLFGFFQRMHDEAEYPGLGLGLAASRRIVNRHGGRIWIESAPDQGTTVFFTLA